MENDLKEAAACGDTSTLQKLLDQDASIINSQHKMNKWTALHWAARRNQEAAVDLLLQYGADSSLMTSEGKLAQDLTSSNNIAVKLGGKVEDSVSQSEPDFRPHYLQYPMMPSYKQQQPPVEDKPAAVSTSHSVGYKNDKELVLKTRVADAFETDFIEVELNYEKRTFSELLSLLCAELGVDENNVLKVRKLPNTILRKDKDIKRLVDFQEIELVLVNQTSGTKSFVCTPSKDTAESNKQNRKVTDLNGLFY